MKKYTIGLITGALLATSAMMFMGSQNKNLGDIVVNSITVLDDGNGGFIKTFNTDGKLTVYLGTGEGGLGILKTFNTDGKETVYLGTGEGGLGSLSTSNGDGKETAYLGTSNEGSGWLVVSNDGSIETLNAEGKKTAYLGTGEGGAGYLSTYNEHEVKTGYFGTDNNNDGMVVLFDRYGDVGWSASGKQ